MLPMKKTTERAIARLCQQFHMTPEQFTERALDAMVKNVDNNTAFSMPIFEDELFEDFDCTARLNGMNHYQLARLADTHPIPQIALWRLDCKRRGVKH